MFTFIVLLFVIPFLTSLLFHRWLHTTDWIVHSALAIYISNLLFNILTYCIYNKSIINLIEPESSIYLYCIITCLCANILVYYLRIWMRRYAPIFIYKKTTLFLGIIFTITFVYFNWLLGDSGRQPFELFIYNLGTPVNSSVANFNVQLFGLLFFIMIMSISFSIIIYRYTRFESLKYRKRKEIGRKKQVISVLFPILLLSLSIMYPVYSFHLEQAYTYFFTVDNFIENNYVTPDDKILTWPQEKRNLVYVFVESFESSYFSEELGGMNDTNLLPNLTNLMDQGTSFSNHENGFGGAISMPQATVTIAGVVASLGGVNYKIPAGMESDTTIGSVPSLITLNDLLYAQGYNAHFMIGSYIDDYNIGPFFRAHGETKTQGLVEKRVSGDLPEDYKVWWGFEDSKLYQFAKEDLNTISQAKEPFVYTIISNDTHRTGGYTDPTCPVDESVYPMENAISCTDKMLSEFLMWIMKQPFYETTTVVVVGDHLGHKEEYVSSLNPQSDRRIFNLILNSQSPETTGLKNSRDFWAADMFPTVLSSLGVEIEGNRLGLGANLFSSVPSLVELYGEDTVSSALEKNSPFFTEAFLSPK